MGYVLFSIILSIWAFWLVAKQKDFSLQVLYFIICLTPALLVMFVTFDVYSKVGSNLSVGWSFSIALFHLAIICLLAIISIVEWVISIIMKIKEQNEDKEKNNDYDTTRMIPAEIKKFNWGALWFSGFWGVLNHVWISLIAFILINIPDYGIFLYVPFCIWLGFKGNELAWKAKKWKSIEHFNNTQIRWAVIGNIIAFCIFVSVITDVVKEF